VIIHKWMEAASAQAGIEFGRAKAAVVAAHDAPAGGPGLDERIESFRGW
jgi:hypothetical protein